MTKIITSEELKEGVLKVRDRIIEKGWTQGPFIDEEGRICLAEATYVLRPSAEKYPTGQEWGNSDEYQLFKTVRGAIKDHVGMDIVGYSEAHGRTKEEVLGMLEEVALKRYTPPDIERLRHIDY